MTLEGLVDPRLGLGLGDRLLLEPAEGRGGGRYEPATDRLGTRQLREEGGALGGVGGELGAIGRRHLGQEAGHRAVHGLVAVPGAEHRARRQTVELGGRDATDLHGVVLVVVVAQQLRRGQQRACLHGGDMDLYDQAVVMFARVVGSVGSGEGGGEEEGQHEVSWDVGDQCRSCAISGVPPPAAGTEELREFVEIL